MTDLALHTEAVKLNRQEKVASLMLRGLSQREILVALPQLTPPVLNPESGKPYGLGTVSRDCQALKEKWKLAAIEDLTTLKGQQIAELREVRRAAWQQNKLFYVLKSLEQEAMLAGTNDLPEIPGINLNVTNFNLSGVSDDDLANLDTVLDAIFVGEDSPNGSGGATEARAIEGPGQT